MTIFKRFCESKGFNPDGQFVINGSSVFDDGSVIELHHDDGTDCPLFKLIEGGCAFNGIFEEEIMSFVPGAYALIDNITQPQP